MNISQKSTCLWIGGGVLGGIVGHFAFKTGTGKTVAAAALGSILVGAIGDAVLEQEQRTGVFSLLPLGR